MRISDWSSDVCSSDLAYAKQIGGQVQIWTAAASGGPAVQATNLDFRPENFAWAADGRGFLVAGRPAIAAEKARNDAEGRKGHSRRSEEHTSELQSLMRNYYAVHCLKKKNK